MPWVSGFFMCARQGAITCGWKSHTGLEQAVVPLRNLPTGGDWLRSPILSQTWTYQSLLLCTWPDHADAILFMRAATPRASIPR